MECELNGWYWGNILLGGIIEMLIVDSATGAMYKLSTESITQILTLNTGGIIETKSQLMIYSINDLPVGLKEDLIQIN